MGCEAQPAENAYSRPLFRQLILNHKLGQTNLVLVYDEGFCARKIINVCVQWLWFVPP